MRDVRVCLVGDEGVGKSTIISSLIKESFVRLAPRTVLPEVTIPPSVTPGHDVTTLIIDTSPRPQDRNHLVNEIRKAHVVAIVYAIDNPTTFDRVPTYWLPTIRSLGVNVPVILIGNKIDLRDGVVTHQALEDEIVPIMQEYKEVETCVECSALLPLNVSEVFFFAQNAVLHPTAPLYDTRSHTLKPACISALSRIFRLIDTDKDGLLSSDELNDFQTLVFDAPLQTRELEGVREVVESMTNGSGIEGESGGINEEGWLALHTFFVQKGRLETTWKALRCFGYGEDLMLREEFLHPRFDIPSDCTCELSPKGYQFFTDIFESYDQDRDGALSPSELDNLFETSPGNPWRDGANGGNEEITVTTSKGEVTLQGWLAQWSMTTLLNPTLTLSYLAYLGYPHSSLSRQPHITNTMTPPLASTSSSSQSSFPFSTSPASSKLLPSTSALQITKPRRPSRRKPNVSVERNCFLAYVLGASGSGKTSLLRAFIGKGFNEDEGDQFARRRIGGNSVITGDKGDSLRGKGKSVVNCVEEGGGERYLVLQEFGSTYESEVLRNKKKLELADVLIFVYDSSDTNSFSYISNLRQQYKLDDIPSLFVATKSDLDLAQQVRTRLLQRHEVQPDTYCRKLQIRVPVSVSVKRGELAELFHTIVRIAIHPMSSIPYAPSRTSSTILGLSSSNPLSLVLTTGATVGVVAVGLMWWLRSNSTSTLGGPGTSGLGIGGGGRGGLWNWFSRR
ncbi:ERMES complex Ca(2+)-binding regulatory GTPase GEM1 [Sporobolomyces koalae]|uniref:ERMES complex Ca(2+)-binding regulatory GTPase GEM1 n=1 Tax=Sporobolomyces koalae TaxID=500713 RepID=UPI00317A17E5